jgi:TonB-linked SusC/RagA family outer membrane protein
MNYFFKRKHLIFLIFCSFILNVLAPLKASSRTRIKKAILHLELQREQITGNVKDGLGNPLPGASIVIKGSKTGTLTDVNGNFKITANVGSVLIVSFIGYENQEITVGSQTNYQIILKDAGKDLESVVVTALGIKRSQKALSYNVQEVKGDELTRVKDPNLVNSLSGKVAGLNINSSSSGAGGASKVVMRGAKSIERSSNALYVIDGVPMYNQQGTGSTEFGSAGSTESVADINPEDIESISVLTGAAAAALYGSDASNGAILLTTKKGLAGKTEFTVNSNTEFSSAFIKPKFQNRYGTGNNGILDESSDKSWGNLLNSVAKFNYEPTKDFLNTGKVYTNSIALSTGSEKNQTYFSAAAVNAEGLIPNNTYNRYNFTFKNTTSLLKDKLKIDFTGNYIIQKDQNMINQGDYGNPLVSAYLLRRGDDFDAIKVFERYDAALDYKTQYWPQGEGSFRMQNPYWAAYRNLRNNDRQRYALSVGANYDATSWLNITGRVRVDNEVGDYTEKYYASSNDVIAEGPNGLYGKTNTKNKQTYADLIAHIKKNVKDFSFNVDLGGSFSDIRSTGLKVRGPIDPSLNQPNLFTVYNLEKLRRIPEEIGGNNQQRQSVFGSAEIGYQNKYFITLTERLDWASQLAGSDKKYFDYPSIGASAILSDIFKLPTSINYMKVRAALTDVGIPYAVGLSTPTYPFDQGTGGFALRKHFPLGKLLPEKTKSYEFGLTTKFLNHFNLDFTYYLADTRNQTFNPQISVSSGYSTIYVQTGKVRNQGVELALGYSNKFNDLSWSSNFTLGLNRNKILELVDNFVHPETGEIINKDRLEIGGLNYTRFILKKGGSLGDLYSNVDLKRDQKGNYLVDENGRLITENNLADISLGSVFPKANLAWRNSFSYKGFDLNFLFSARLGGVVYSATEAALDLYGVSNSSAVARDNGGVIINGGDLIPAQTWYQAIGDQRGIPQYYTYSATNVRLQEASLGYTIPRSKIKNIGDITLSVVGRNLWMIYNKAPFDPESIATTGNYYQGIDNFMMPSTRNIGLNLKVKF